MDRKNPSSSLHLLEGRTDSPKGVSCNNSTLSQIDVFVNGNGAKESILRLIHLLDFNGGIYEQVFEARQHRASFGAVPQYIYRQ